MKLTVSTYVADRLVGLNKNDLSVKPFKGSGPGGQHRNKVETAIRIAHIKTGIHATASDNKSQSQNKKEAFRRLVKKLVVHYQGEELSALLDVVNPVAQRIRTYNEQRGTVKDHRSGIVANYRAVLDGDLDVFSVKETA